VISIMVGDLQRIRLYPGKGFQVPQEIPPEVWDAYRELVALGYDRHLCEPEAG
ncbi:MAG: YdcF family protein, partial [Planctomycetota bacterium]